MKKLLNLIFFISITFIFTSKLFAIEEKIKIGLLLPLDGQNHNIGKSVLRAVNLAVNKIDDPILEVYPKNNFDNPEDNIKAAQELYDQGVRIFIGPIFDKNTKNLGKFDDAIFITFSNKNNDKKSVVRIEYPRKGVWAVGFATKENKGEMAIKTNKKLINVFIPTTPNPTSGFLLMFPIDEVIYLDMSFEEASKFIVSAGTSTKKS